MGREFAAGRWCAHPWRQLSRILAPDLAAAPAGIERGDSLAFDFHKWGQVPYDAGFILVRDGTLHRHILRRSISLLAARTRGLGPASPWRAIRPDLSRGFAR